MEYINLGSTGLKVSRLALGCMTYGSKQWRPWVLDEQDSEPFIRRAWELGINFFDTADMYSLGASEEVLGRTIKALGIPRENLVIATKLFYPLGDGPNQRGLSRKHIRHSIEGSLRRLGTDYVDLYQIHRFDKQTPIEETMDALGEVVRSGKALYLGAFHARLSTRQDAARGGAAGIGPFCQHAESLQHHLSGRRAGDAALLP